MDPGLIEMFEEIICALKFEEHMHNGAKNETNLLGTSLGTVQETMAEDVLFLYRDCFFTLFGLFRFHQPLFGANGLHVCHSDPFKSPIQH